MANLSEVSWLAAYHRLCLHLRPHCVLTDWQAAKFIPRTIPSAPKLSNRPIIYRVEHRALNDPDMGIGTCLGVQRRIRNADPGNPAFSRSRSP